jgi:protein-S-isoprenylcysteine O-methyltransferase Ste14
MLALYVFLGGSLGLIILSARSFTSQFSYGMPRFIAFEAVLGLVVLNAPAWFVEPFSLLQLISWVMLLDAAYLVIHAIWALRHYGQPDPSNLDASRLTLEKTTRLVTRGPYQSIRHPMYASLLWLAWAIFLKQPTPLAALLGVLASVALFITATWEEKFNLQVFGDEYLAYMRRTKRFIPYVV